MRIDLEIHRRWDLEASHGRRRLFLYRLWTRIRFRQATGWSEPQPALVDTGAPYSLIPSSLWPVLRVTRLASQSIRGIVPGDHAEMRAHLAKVSAQLLDATHRSPRLAVWAMLADSDRVPLILGWAGCLDRTRLTIDSPHHRAWLEF